MKIQQILVMCCLLTGLLTGCGQKWVIVRQIVWQIVRHSILNFKCFRGVLNDALIGILVYFSDGIDTIS